MDTQEFGSIVAEVLATPEVVAAIAAMGSFVIGAWLLAAFWAFRDTADRSHSDSPQAVHGAGRPEVAAGRRKLRSVCPEVRLLWFGD